MQSFRYPLWKRRKRILLKFLWKKPNPFCKHLLLHVRGKPCKLLVSKIQIKIRDIVHLLANCLYRQTLSFSDRIGKVASSPADLCHLWRLEKHFCCTDGPDWSISVTSSSDTPNRVANVFQPFTASGFWAILTKARLR